MKIVLVITSLNMGGAERVCSLIANNLIKRGYEVVIILKEKNEFKKEYEVSKKVKIINLDTNYLRFIPKLKKRIDLEQPDTIIGFLTPNNIIISLLKILKLTNAKVIIRETTIKSISNARKNFFKKNIMNFLIKKTYKHANLVIALSEGCKKDLINFYKIPVEKIKRIYNPLDINEIQNMSNEPINQKLGRYNKTIICVGSFVYSKGHEYLLEAVRILNEKGLHYNLLLLGEGYLQQDLITQSKEYLDENQMMIINHTNNPFKYMKQADVLVLPSLWEGFGNVLIESMAVGTPVVSTTCESGPKEIITSELDGLLVSPKNPNELSKAIERVLENNKYKDYLIENAHQTLKSYQIEKILNEYENIL